MTLIGASTSKLERRIDKDSQLYQAAEMCLLA